MEPRERNEQLAGEIAGIAAGIRDELSTDRWKKPVMRSFGTPGLPSFLKSVETLIRQSRELAEAKGDSGMIEGIDNAIGRLSALTTGPDLAETARGGTDVDSIRQRRESRPVFLDQGRVAWEEPVEPPHTKAEERAGLRLERKRRAKALMDQSADRQDPTSLAVLDSSIKPRHPDDYFGS